MPPGSDDQGAEVERERPTLHLSDIYETGSPSPAGYSCTFTIVMGPTRSSLSSSETVPEKPSKSPRSSIAS